MGGSHPHNAHSDPNLGTPGYSSSSLKSPHRVPHHHHGHRDPQPHNTTPSPTATGLTLTSYQRQSPAPAATAVSQNPAAQRPKLRGMGLQRRVSLEDAQRELTSSLSEMRLQEGDHVLFDYVANSIVGKDIIFNGPFGQRKVIYLDYIASGRPLTFIEEYINKEVLPNYANTHTTTSYTARQTTVFRNEARAIIHSTTNATDEDVVIFTGNGVTGAIHKLIHALSFTEPPVVFIGPYEHHSNILPWREMNAEIVRIQQTENGLVDLEHLEEKLQEWSPKGLRMVGSFSAASNVTGILSNVDTISILLHKYGAIALWDYATAAPYVRLDMNPVVAGDDKGLAYKDAIFVSPHKFVGGVGSPGLLIAKKKLFLNNIPHDCGGGTVLLVRQTGHRYLQNLEEREEGGTPAIVGAIRAGLTFQLKDAITPELIMHREQQLFRAARESWGKVSNLVILGNLEVERLPIFSFLVHHPETGYYLHHNYVACVLNDLFGIQARGGCACAGPYAMDLLGISEEQAKDLEELLVTPAIPDKAKKRAPQQHFGDSVREIFKPGFTRLNLPYFMSEEQFHFVLQAVTMVAEQGWKLLPQYKFNPRTGEWKHEGSQESKQQMHLDQLSYSKGYLEVQLPKPPGQDTLPHSPQDCLNQARRMFAEAKQNITTIPDQSHLFEDFARSSRWFLLPSEANEVLHAYSQIRSLGPTKPFICPKKTQSKQPALYPEVPGSNISSSNASLSSSPRTIATSLASSGDTPGHGKEKKSPLHVRKIKVSAYQNGGPKWKL